MDHDLIDDEHIPERYLMGKLSQTEAEAFEQHYLSCPPCLERVEMGERFARGMKRMAAEDAVAAALLARAGWLARIARLSSPARFVLASALLLALLMPLLFNRHLNQKLELLRAPQINTQVLNLSPQRGAATDGTGPSHQLSLPAEPAWVVLSLELDTVDRASYAVSLIDARGQVVWKADGLQVNAYDALAVSLHSSFLQPGDYVLAVEGEGGLPHFAFRILQQEKTN